MLPDVTKTGYEFRDPMFQGQPEPGASTAVLDLPSNFNYWERRALSGHPDCCARVRLRGDQVTGSLNPRD